MTAARPSGVISQFCGLARSLWVMPARRSARRRRMASAYHALSAGRARCSGAPSVHSRISPSRSTSIRRGVPGMPETARKAAISRRASAHATGRVHQGAALTTRRITTLSGAPARWPLWVSENRSRLSTACETKSVMPFPGSALRLAADADRAPGPLGARQGGMRGVHRLDLFQHVGREGRHLRPAHVDVEYQRFGGGRKPAVLVAHFLEDVEALVVMVEDAHVAAHRVTEMKLAHV